MKEISRSIFLGVLLALPVIYILDNGSTPPLTPGEIAFILFLTTGTVQLLTSLFRKKGTKNVEN